MFMVVGIMTEEQLQVYYEKFPAVLKEKLKNGNLYLPENTEYDYVPIEAHRMVIRKDDDNTPFNLEDMKSYYQLGKKPRGGMIDESNPIFYAVSLYENIEMLKMCMDFSNPRKKIAHGYVYKEGGPSLKGEKTHISWWLFSDVDLSGFDIMENENG